MAVAVARAEAVTTVDKVGRRRSKISLYSKIYFIVMAINSQRNQNNHQKRDCRSRKEPTWRGKRWGEQKSRKAPQQQVLTHILIVVCNVAVLPVSIYLNTRWQSTDPQKPHHQQKPHLHYTTAGQLSGHLPTLRTLLGQLEPAPSDIAATVLTIIGSAAIYCFIVIVVIQVNLVILGQCTIIIIIVCRMFFIVL